ncbi:MAG: TonB-dependent receptor [Xanthomonadales bacterium]|jgi:outer membrane receptor protein involved in Fe transport|nr:TonB-dependent receptor [Xanthomonadales bacterium]
MKQKVEYGKTTLTTAIAAALTPAGQALAQDQDADEDRMLEEVIVTATLREASMQDLPQSLQAFTTEDIVRNAFVSFTDVANAIPSLTLIADQPGRNSVKFRGISTGTGEYYTASTSSIYFDETPLTFNSQQLWPAMVDIQRVESLPGPQGTLFGASALAGTVRVVTNKPDPTNWAGEVFGEYFATDGGDPSYNVNGWLNVPLIQDTLAARFVAHTRTDGGWIDNVFGETYVQPDARFRSPGNNAAIVEDNYNEYSLTGGRASLLWNVTDNWAATVALIAEDNSSEGAWGDDTNLPDDQHALFHKENRDDEWWNASLLIEGDFGFATLTSSTTFLDREITYEFDNMIYEQWKDSYFGAYYDLYNSEYTYGFLFNDQTQDRFSQELRLTSTTDSRFQWMIGGFYEEINDKWLYGAVNDDLMDTVMWYYANYLAYYYNYAGYDVTFPLAPTNLGYSQRLDRTNEQLAFFGEATFEITEKWWITGGARWFQFKQDYFEQNQFPEGLPPAGSYDTNGVVTSVSDEDDVVYKFSTQYFFNDDIMAYFLFSQGFRLGGENSERAANTGQVPPTFAPDFLDNWELGAKMTFLDGRMQLNVVGFLLDWRDRQFSISNFEDNGAWWLRGTENGGDTETTGVEISLDWQITDNLLVTGSLTTLDAEISEEIRLADGTELDPGDPLPNSPELSYFLAVDYTFPFELFGGELWTRVDYAYGDEWYDSTFTAAERDPEGLIDDWSNTNLQLGLSLPNNWTLTAFVRNLTNERRVNGRQNNAYASDWFGTPNYRTIEFIQRPRHYGLSVRKGFY